MNLFYIVHNNLKDSILIGFHGHNNMQLAYSHAQTLIDTKIDRDSVIDASVCGMGRGAGNLNTEFLIGYLNENVKKIYNFKYILKLIDENINYFYFKNCRGDLLPYFLSAMYWLHPNYASYLMEKNNLSICEMNEIFSNISCDKRSKFDREHIDQIYNTRMGKVLKVG